MLGHLLSLNLAAYRHRAVKYENPPLASPVCQLRGHLDRVKANLHGRTDPENRSTPLRWLAKFFNVNVRMCRQKWMARVKVVL